MASTDARPIPRKNTAYRVTFPIFDADGDLVTGATGLDSEYSGDAGTFADCTNEATEIATSSGMYYLDLTSGEMNYDTVAIIVKTSSSGAKTTPIVIYPEEAGDVRADVVQWLGTAAATPTVAGVPEVDVTHWLGTAAATPDTAGYVKATIKDGTGAGEIALTSGAIDNVTLTATTTNLTNLPAITTNWLTAAGLDAGAVAEIQLGLATPTNITAGTITTVTNLTNNNDKTGYTLSAAGIQAVWDALTSALTSAGSIGKLIVDNLNATISSRSSHSAADVWAAGTRTLTAIDEDSTTLDLDATVRAAVGLTTANLDTQLDALPTAIENADALLNRDLSTGTDSGSATVRTARQALRFLRNKWAVSGTTLTVYKEDDSTASWTGTVSTDGAADPITGNDPASS